MARTSTIRISQGRRGTTIRATGGAAQALFEAITGAAERTKAAVEAPVAPAPAKRFVLRIRVVDKGNTYHAQAFDSCGTTPPHLIGLSRTRATCTAGARQAVSVLLAKAEPPLVVQEWLLETRTTTGAYDFSLVAEAL
ncbi:hypothetical protein [Zoogloea sp.]|uniref:hypothetical protein n=1 Tax=Zoogloea sp. TaxID=49181 RepID=UPI0035B2CC18